MEHRGDRSYTLRIFPARFLPHWKLHATSSTTRRSTWDARRGARELYAAYKKVSLRVDDFEGPRYKRIDHIQGLLASGRLNADLRWQTVESERELQAKGS